MVCYQIYFAKPIVLYPKTDRANLVILFLTVTLDAAWVENMNSVMDDNKLLTLPNGERIRLKDHCKLLFEVANLAHASPATVSRCGMVYVDPKTLGFQPICTSWIKKQSTEVLRSLFSRLFDKYVGALVEFCLEGVSDDEAPPTSSIQRTPSNYGSNYVLSSIVYFHFLQKMGEMISPILPKNVVPLDQTSE